MIGEERLGARDGSRRKIMAEIEPVYVSGSTEDPMCISIKSRQPSAIVRPITAHHHFQV